MQVYFNVFQLPETASLEDVKLRYIELAKIYHPDKNNGNKNSSDKFRFIKEAYEKIEQFIKIEETYKPKRISGISKQITYTNEPPKIKLSKAQQRNIEYNEWIIKNPPKKAFSDPIFNKKN